MKYKYIYKTVNLTNGKAYIGQHSTDIEYDNYRGSGPKLLEDIKKYGLDNFVRGIIEYCEDKEELNEREKYWIKYYNTIEEGYNICKGGGDYPVLYGKNNGFYGKKHSDETKEKIRKSREGKTPWNKGKTGIYQASEKQKKIASERHSGEGNWNYGKKGELSPSFGLKRSKKTKKLYSETKKGAKNPNVGVFEILTPDDKKYITASGIPDFLEKHPEYNSKKWVLYHSKRLNKRYQGWRVTSISL